MWRDAYAESRVLSADPASLIRMVYEYAVESTREARKCLIAGDIRGRANAISRAMAAISELEGSLNHDAGGEVARNLAELYYYCRGRLTEANMRQLDAPLAEAESLLARLAEAWEAVRPAQFPQHVDCPAVPAPATIWAQPPQCFAHSWSA